MKTKQKDNQTRHVSVLGAVAQDKKPKGMKTITVSWIVFMLWLLVAVMADLSVYLLTIPEFNELQVHEGMVKITKGGKRNSYLALDTGDRVIDFTCWITSAGTSNCLKKEQWPFYVGKQARVYSYRTQINGVFHENRLLQLEVEGEVAISYQEQKAKYQRSKDTHPYLHTLMVIPILIWISLLYLSNNRNPIKEENKP